MPRKCLRFVAEVTVEGEAAVAMAADRYDRDLVDVFAVQDELTAAVAGALAPTLERDESVRARRGGCAGVGSLFARNVTLSSIYEEGRASGTALLRPGAGPRSRVERRTRLGGPCASFRRH